MFRVLSVVLVAFVLCGATNPPSKVEEARAAFKTLPLHDRLDVQSLLTANGYWSAVANDAFGPKLMAAIEAFQRDNGLAPTGILTPEQRQLLREKASPLLRKWGLSPVRHPSAPATLWVPKGLNLSTKRDGGDLEFEAKSDELMVSFLSFPGGDLGRAFSVLKGIVLKGRNTRIEYEVLKDDFFVISSGGGGVSAYTRFQRQGGSIVGFSMLWASDSSVRGERLAVVMSDLFRASVELKQNRQPPTPVEGGLSADTRFIVIASRTEQYEAVLEAREHHARLSELAAAVGVGTSFDGLFVARFSNGRYAVVIGPLKASEAASIRDGFKSKGIIPDDSFVSDGSKLLDVVWVAPKDAGQTTAASPPPSPSRPKEASVSTGTGFYVGPKTILTNAHVVEGCTAVTTSLNRNPVLGKVVARDEANDLALISAGEESPKTAVFRGGVKLGEDIAAFGFPLSEQLASSGNFTRGNVTATAGVHDDSRHLQFSAPIQPGNSGGPLLDETGNVIGVIFAKMKDTRTADGAGNNHQNVNFAIKTVIAISFLESNSVASQSGVAGEALRPADLAAKAQGFTVAIRCQQ